MLDPGLRAAFFNAGALFTGLAIQNSIITAVTQEMVTTRTAGEDVIVTVRAFGFQMVDDNSEVTAGETIVESLGQRRPDDAPYFKDDYWFVGMRLTALFTRPFPLARSETDQLNYQ